MVHVLKRHTVLLVQTITLISYAFFSQCCFTSRAIWGWDVVINEFDPNPPSGPQWVELFNPADFPRDLSLWKITTESSWMIYMLSVGTTIQAKGYVTVDLPAGMINSAGDSVILKDKSELVIDRTPLLGKPLMSGNAWARFPNGVDTDSLADWRLQPATKGASNSVPLPPPVTPTILCMVSSFSVQIGSSVTVRVRVAPPRSAPVTIQSRAPGTLEWHNVTTATTDSLGSYEYAWTPEALGEYGVRAYVYPSDSIPGMYSPATSFLVTKVRTLISCSATRHRVTLGQDLATYGYLTPALEGVSITLTYRKPTGDPIVRYVTTSNDGLYNDTSFTPNEVGSWNVTASWEGDETHTSASSFMAYFSVEPPPSPPFGMWLIIGMVVSVTIGAVLLAAGLSSKLIQKPPRRVALCPQCGSTLLYVPSIQGWYCRRCRRHF